MLHIKSPRPDSLGRKCVGEALDLSIVAYGRATLYHRYIMITLARMGRGCSTLCVCVCVCVCACVLPQNCCLSSIISKSKQAASHKLGNLRQKVVLYKTGKFLQASMAQTVLS